jgi:hypothetical protein
MSTIGSPDDDAMMQHMDCACLGTDGALTAAVRDAMNQRYEKLLADFERCTADLGPDAEMGHVRSR